MVPGGGCDGLAFRKPRRMQGVFLEVIHSSGTPVFATDTSRLLGPSGLYPFAYFTLLVFRLNIVTGLLWLLHRKNTSEFQGWN